MSMLASQEDYDEHYDGGDYRRRNHVTEASFRVDRVTVIVHFVPHFVLQGVAIWMWGYP